MMPVHLVVGYMYVPRITIVLHTLAGQIATGPPAAFLAHNAIMVIAKRSTAVAAATATADEMMPLSGKLLWQTIDGCCRQLQKLDGCLVWF